MLAQEARALLTRLARVKPFALHESMLPAAAILPTAQIGHRALSGQGTGELRELVHTYLNGSVVPRAVEPAQRKRSAASPFCG